MAARSTSGHITSMRRSWCRQFDARAPSLPTQTTESPLTRRTRKRARAMLDYSHPRAVLGVRDRLTKPSPRNVVRDRTNFSSGRAQPSSGDRSQVISTRSEASVLQLRKLGRLTTSKTSDKTTTCKRRLGKPTSRLEWTSHSLSLQD